MFRFLLLCTIAITCSFCKSDKNDTNANEATANSDNAAQASAAPVKKNYEASHEAPFCKLWVVKAPLGVSNPQDYKGLWFDLKKDGTFESGRYQEQTNYGRWSIGKETEILKLLFNTLC